MGFNLLGGWQGPRQRQAGIASLDFAFALSFPRAEKYPQLSKKSH